MEILIVFTTSQKNIQYEAYICFLLGIASFANIHIIFFPFSKANISAWICDELVVLPSGYQDLFSCFSPNVINVLSKRDQYVDEIGFALDAIRTNQSVLNI